MSLLSDSFVHCWHCNDSLEADADAVTCRCVFVQFAFTALLMCVGWFMFLHCISRVPVKRLYTTVCSTTWLLVEKVFPKNSSLA